MKSGCVGHYLQPMVWSVINRHTTRPEGTPSFRDPVEKGLLTVIDHRAMSAFSDGISGVLGNGRRS